MEQVISLVCPHCGCSAQAVLENTGHKIYMYTCHKCWNALITYKDQTRVLPSKVASRLMKRYRVSCCGSVYFNKRSPDRSPINADDVLDLRKFLERVSDSATIIANL